MADRAKLARFGGQPALTREDAIAGMGPWPEVQPEDIEAVVKVLQGREEPYGFLHSEIVGFQHDYAEHAGVPHTLAVASGTAALHLAAIGIGAQAGDEIITPALGYIASGVFPLHHNCIPVFVDVDPLTFNLDPALVEAAITPRTRAIVAVDLLGLPADYAALEEIAARHDLAIIADSSHSQGAHYRGRPVGSLGDVSAASLMATKNLAGCGEAGIVSTASEHVMSRVHAHASMGMNIWGRAKDELERVSHQLGFNYRPTPTTVAFLRCQLRRLPQHHAARQERAAIVNACLDEIPFLRAPHVPEDRSHGYQMYRIVVEPERLDMPRHWAQHLRDAFVFLLRAEGGPVGFWERTILPSMPVFQHPVGYGGGYPWVCSSQPIPNYDPGQFPIANHVLDASFIAPLTRSTHPLELVRRNTKPYYKVAEHADFLKDLTADIADAGGFEAWSGTSIHNERALRSARLEM